MAWERLARRSCASCIVGLVKGHRHVEKCDLDTSLAHTFLERDPWPIEPLHSNDTRHRSLRRTLSSKSPVKDSDVLTPRYGTFPSLPRHSQVVVSDARGDDLEV